MRFFAEAGAIAAFLEHEGGVTGWRFTLDADELRGLAQRFGLLLPEGETEAQLGTPHGLDAAPYLVHTHYELPLMLDGRKPFAVFTDTRFDSEPGFEKLRAFFRPHVKAGRIVEHFSCERRLFPISNGGEKEAWETELFYTLPGEEWRIAAWKTLMRERAGRWREEDTREEGRLMGYKPDQCDWFLQWQNSRRGGL